MKKYEELKKIYPEDISLQQFYQICKIAKRSAAYLLQHQIVPCIDNGKGTWRYKIKIDDVIIYLRTRDKKGSMIPRGALTTKKRKQIDLFCYPAILREKKEQFIKYLNIRYDEFPDALTVEYAIKITGVSGETIRRRISDGSLEAICLNRCSFIAKEDLYEFMLGEKFMRDYCNYPHIQEIISSFEKWLDKI